MASKEDKIVTEVKTPFQRITLSKLPDGEHALYLDDAIQFVTGYDDKAYHGVLSNLPAKMLRGRPGSVLILGGGDGLAARNLVRFPNVEKVTMVELDPGMIKFCKEHPFMKKLNEGAFEHPKFNLHVMDARKFLDRPPSEKYNVAIIDFPDPLEPSLEDLFGVPFYQKVHEHMDQQYPIYAVQASTAFGNVETQVEHNLSRVTRTKSYPVRFRGEWMEDGAIVFSGNGVVPSMTKIPSNVRAEEPADPASVF